MSEMNHEQKIQSGLLQGNLRHMVERVAGFKKAKEELQKAGKGRVITKESQRQEAEAAELGKFMDFCGPFGEFDPWHSKYFGEPGLLGAMHPYKYDIITQDDGSTDIKCKNICLFWPLRILQQLYSQQERKIILAG